MLMIMQNKDNEARAGKQSLFKVIFLPINLDASRVEGTILSTTQT
jgi:hypothetical protein